MERRILFATKWLHLLELRDPDNGINGYVCSHAEWTKGQGIAVLPYRVVRPHEPVLGGEYTQYLLRWEITPCWGIEPSLSSITGGMDKEGELPIECAARELEEEGGYRVSPSSLRWRPLGTMRVSKSSTTLMHLFAVDLSEGSVKPDPVEKVEAVGDRTALEDKAHCEWLRRPGDAVDALTSAMAYRLDNFKAYK